MDLLAPRSGGDCSCCAGDHAVPRTARRTAWAGSGGSRSKRTGASRAAFDGSRRRDFTVRRGAALEVNCRDDILLVERFVWMFLDRERQAGDHAETTGLAA